MARRLLTGRAPNALTRQENKVAILGRPCFFMDDNLFIFSDFI
ncbi:Hypothetical protein ETEE_3451 [Edwardsiella anguillarum ET080813]|uniref:Uncharacterized protein n=1 Tax=Edwardsiella anguillarum ET080813 TaxID=667120 RepID=A0A076LTR3_9GAMM|nr:Hypothetical protein ETEE_3451 [Edwardsiella anguillarum ET080813]